MGNWLTRLPRDFSYKLKCKKRQKARECERAREKQRREIRDEEGNVCTMAPKVFRVKLEKPDLAAPLKYYN